LRLEEEEKEIAMSLSSFPLPDLGEGLTEGEILHWLVQPGDTVRLNQPIVEVETAKAAVELPSPYAGVVHELLHAEGETVPVGSPIITVDTATVPAGTPTGAQEAAAARTQAEGAAANPAESATAALQAVGSAPDRVAVTADTVPAGVAALVDATTIGRPDADEAVEPGLIGGPAPGGRTSVLVGYGPKSVTAVRRARKPSAPSVSPLPAGPAAPTGTTALPGERPAARVSAAAVGERAARAAGAVTVLAKPPVRKRARDLGIDLTALRGTGPAGTITRADVEDAAADRRPASGNGGAAAPGQSDVPPYELAPAPRSAAVPDREERLPIKGVRRLTAQATVTSAFTAPHVTEFLTVDVTKTVKAVDKLRRAPGFESVRVSPLLLVARAVLLALRRHPLLNSSWDEAAQEIVVKRYVHLGIAAATPRGLVVPVLRDADTRTLPELGQALTELVATAREGRTPPADLTGSTFTITNVGVFGVDTGTPILNPGEAGILAVGAIAPRPWVHKGRVRSRQVATLALSFDHRIIDGELGSRFLADVGRVLTDPAMTALAWA